MHPIQFSLLQHGIIPVLAHHWAKQFTLFYVSVHWRLVQFVEGYTNSNDDDDDAGDPPICNKIPFV